MKRSWFPIFLVFGLLGLLVLLATLQYQWLGQISEGEGERLKARLESDTKRFAEDFNREIQSAETPIRVHRRSPAAPFHTHPKTAISHPLNNITPPLSAPLRPPPLS